MCPLHVKYSDPTESDNRLRINLITIEIFCLNLGLCLKHFNLSAGVDRVNYALEFA